MTDKNMTIGMLALAMLLSILGVNPLRAFLGSMLIMQALDCFVGAGVNWLVSCCPADRHIHRVLIGLMFAGLAVLVFVI